MIRKALGLGLRASAGRPKLVLILWAWGALVAAIAALPAWQWWRNVVAFAPATDTLLERFSLGILTELTQYDRYSSWNPVQGGFLAAILLGLVANPLMAGGTLEVLLADDRRSFMHRFHRGAGHFYWRFFRLLVVTALAGFAVLALVAMGIDPALRPLAESSWEPGWVVAIVFQLVVLGALALVFYMVLDYARIRVALDDSRGMLRAWFGALLFVVRRIGGTVGITIGIGALVAIAAAVYLGFRETVPSNTGSTILAMVLAQQAFMVLRSGLRAAHVGAELEYYRALAPRKPTGEVAAAREPEPEVLVPPAVETPPTAPEPPPTAPEEESAAPPGSSQV